MTVLIPMIVVIVSMGALGLYFVRNEGKKQEGKASKADARLPRTIADVNAAYRDRLQSSDTGPQGPVDDEAAVSLQPHAHAH